MVKNDARDGDSTLDQWFTPFWAAEELVADATLGHHLQQEAKHRPEGDVREILHGMGTAAKFAADDLRDQMKAEATSCTCPGGDTLEHLPGRFYCVGCGKPRSVKAG